MNKILSILCCIFFQASAMDSSDSDTMLYEAADSGNLEEVTQALENGAHIQTRYGFGATPLHIVSSRGHVALVNLFISLGANVNATNDSLKTPLIVACDHGHTQAAAILLENGADVNHKDNDEKTPLIWACQEGHTETAKLLIAAGADVNAVSMRNDTAITLASLRGHTDTVRLLLAFAADVNLPDFNRWSALVSASCFGHSEIVKLLVGSGAHGGISGGASQEVGWLGNLLSAFKRLSGLNSSRERIIKLMRDLQKFFDLPIERIEASAEYHNWSFLYKVYRIYVKRDDLGQKNSTHLIWAIAYHKNQAYDHIKKKYPHLLTDAKLVAKYFLLAARVGNVHVIHNLRPLVKDQRGDGYKTVLLKAVFYLTQLHPDLSNLVHQLLSEDIAPTMIAQKTFTPS